MGCAYLDAPDASSGSLHLNLYLNLRFAYLDALDVCSERLDLDLNLRFAHLDALDVSSGSLYLNLN